MNEMNSSSKTKGVILKEAREAKGLSLEAIQEATKIPLDVLKAIEEGYTVRTLSPFYLKGFIKMYAQFIEVDVAHVLDDYHPEKLPKPMKSSMSADDNSSMKFFTQERQKQLITALGIMVALFLVFKIGGCFLRKRSNDPSVQKIAQISKQKDKSVKSGLSAKKESIKKPSHEEKEKPRVEEKTVPPKSETPAVEAPAPAAKEIPEEDTKKINLTVRAKRKVWLQVRTDNNLVFQSTLKEGVVETWEADQTIELSGKNVGSLEFELNGKVIGVLGGANRDARRVIVTRQGLTVKQ